MSLGQENSNGRASKKIIETKAMIRCRNKGHTRTGAIRKETEDRWNSAAQL